MTCLCRCACWNGSRECWLEDCADPDHCHCDRDECSCYDIEETEAIALAQEAMVGLGMLDRPPKVEGYGIRSGEPG